MAVRNLQELTFVPGNAENFFFFLLCKQLIFVDLPSLIFFVSLGVFLSYC